MVRSVRVAVVLFLAFALLVLTVAVADDPHRPLGGRLLAGAALGGLYAAPGVLGLLAGRGRRRPSLLAAGGALGLALVPTSMSITPLLVVPSVLLLVAQGRAAASSPAAAPPPRLPVVATVALTVALGWGAFLAGFLSTDPVCWTNADGSGCASDSTTPLEAGARLGITALLLVTAYAAAGPPPTPTRSSPVAST